MKRLGILGCLCFFLGCVLGCFDSGSNTSDDSENSQANENLSAGDGTQSSASEGSSSSVYVHTPGFNPCQFNFGAGWQAAHEDSAFYAGVDYISVWLGDNSYFNGFEKRMLDVALSIHATPMIYAYVIAEFGKDQGLVDCDITDSDGNFVTPNHCTDGAELIRNHFQDSILYRYREYAKGFREELEWYNEFLESHYDPDTMAFIWLIEPDYYQYSESGDTQDHNFEQKNGAISDSMMGVYFSQIVDTIKAYLPGSKIAIDISPWVTDQAAWYSHFDLSKVDYASTSGGRTLAGNTRIRMANTLTWAEISQLLNKPVLADAGYDAGGYGTGYNKAWGNVINLNARIADGVVGVTQMDPDELYASRLDSIRQQLSPIPGCAE